MIPIPHKNLLKMAHGVGYEITQPTCTNIVCCETSSVIGVVNHSKHTTLSLGSVVPATGCKRGRQIKSLVLNA